MTIIYDLSQVSIIYAEENVYTKQIASRILIEEKKNSIFRSQFLGLLLDSDLIFQDSQIHE